MRSFIANMASSNGASKATKTSGKTQIVVDIISDPN
jgi:hypothetical protein